MAHSIYLADRLHDHVLSGVAYAMPSSIHIALFTSVNGLDTNIEGVQDEVSGGGYTRLLIDGSTRSFTPSANKATTNAEDWEFPSATASWGIISHIAIMDAATSGNVLYYGELAVAKDVASGDIFRFLAGEFDSTLS